MHCYTYVIYVDSSLLMDTSDSVWDGRCYCWRTVAGWEPGSLVWVGAVWEGCHWLVALLMLFALVLIWLSILLNYAECQEANFKLWNWVFEMEGPLALHFAPIGAQLVLLWRKSMVAVWRDEMPEAVGIPHLKQQRGISWRENLMPARGARGVCRRGGTN